MFGSEVDYRLAKWLLLNMAKDGIISPSDALNTGRYSKNHVPTDL